MPRVVLDFDAKEVYGDAAQAFVDLFNGNKTEAEVGYNALRVAPATMDSWLAAPIRAAIEGRGTARIEVAAEPEAAATPP